MFTIEKNIPIPEKSGRISLYPFNLMEVGDSFFVPFGDIDPKLVKRHIALAISTANNKNSVPSPNGETKLNSRGFPVPVMVPIKKFSSKCIDNGMRVWRII